MADRLSADDRSRMPRSPEARPIADQDHGGIAMVVAVALRGLAKGGNLDVVRYSRVQFGIWPTQRPGQRFDFRDLLFESSGINRHHGGLA